MGIDITHTPANGTLVDGTSRGDGSGEVLKRHGFRWSRNLASWYLPHSRDNRVKSWKVNPAADDLRAAGFDVTVTVDDDDARPYAEAEAERAERAENRADRYSRYADNAADRADSARASYEAMSDGWPLGQPIISDRARVAHKRMMGAHDRGVRETRKADHWDGRAEAAEGNQRYRESVPVTLRRIEKLEAEKRVYVRALGGDTIHGWRVKDNPGQREELNSRIAVLDEQITYWRDRVAEAEKAGAKIWGRDDFAKGDFVKANGNGTWYEVLRVNAKSVTVPAVLAGAGVRVATKAGNPYSWTDTIPYHTVWGRASADEVAELVKKAEEAG